MRRAGVVLLLGCAVSAPVMAQPRMPRRVLEEPVFTIHPQGALPVFADETVDVVVGWRPVPDAVRYRVEVTGAGKTTELETTGVRIEQQGLTPGRYQVTVTAIDKLGNPGTPSEPLPINVIEVRAVPPGADRSAPPTRGAYAVGTRFSVPGMHCVFSDAPIDDLLVGPENVARMPKPGAVLLRCAGIPGYLEKHVVIAPVRVAVHSPRIVRGGTTNVTVTLASVAALGDRLDVEAIGDIALGDAQRTEYGLEVPVTAADDATSATLSVQAAGLELGRVPLELVDAPPPVVRAPPQVEWKALDLGGQFGVFAPPSGADDGTTLGGPTDPGDVITGGPLIGLRLGLFPVRRVGLEGEVSLIGGGYANESGVSRILAARAQIAVRVLESGSLGLRLFAGSGVLGTLKQRGTSERTAESEVHGGAAVTIETSPNLWLRLQISDVVTGARDNGYAHILEMQLGVVTRLGRRDSW